ncbi:MAG: alpha/beta hydrolase [Nevskiaceae bacterium]|nr:MAG: alpha/beta hydrolase [Nevskiaceae bacterium]TBR71399.1 MAG: alpha/beta hydrolase [Nevskiaceae bacterium]
MKSFSCVVLVCVSLALAACAAPGGARYAGGDFGSEGAWLHSVRNVVYDPALGLTLDVYAPRRATNAPLVVFFGGERWARGDKADYGFVGEALASQGFVAVVANYRFYPPATYKQFLGDCARAVVWAQRNAAKYGASANKTFVMGYSAGAYNAAMLALDPEFMKAAGGNRNSLAGMIGISGPYNFLPITAPDLRTIFWPPSDFNKTQPAYWVRSDNPPMLLLASRANQVANAADTQALFAAVKAAGGTVEEVMYDNLSHRDTLTVLATGAQTRADEMKNIVSFVNRTLAKAGSRSTDGSSGIRTQPSPMLPAMTTTPEQLPAPVALPPDAAPEGGSGFQMAP